MSPVTSSSSVARAKPKSKTDLVAILLSPIVGYLIGSLPTAEWLGRLIGVDLRDEGSKNPGTNNALRLGGPALAALGGDVGAVLAAIGAALGNVYNMY